MSCGCETIGAHMRPSLERLEPRRLMSAVVSNGVLVVTGLTQAGIPPGKL